MGWGEMISDDACIGKKKRQHRSKDVKKAKFTNEAHIISIFAGRLT